MSQYRPEPLQSRHDAGRVWVTHCMDEAEATNRLPSLSLTPRGGSSAPRCGDVTGQLWGTLRQAASQTSSKRISGGCIPECVLFKAPDVILTCSQVKKRCLGLSHRCVALQILRQRCLRAERVLSHRDPASSLSARSPVNGGSGTAAHARGKGLTCGRKGGSWGAGTIVHVLCQRWAGVQWRLNTLAACATPC